MSQSKSIILYGLAGLTETSYGSADSVTLGTDGIQLFEEFVITPEYLQSGERGAPPGSAVAQQKFAAPGGRFFTGQPTVQVRGSGAAYSASVKPADIHTLFEISGHSATLVDTVSWTYVPHVLTTTPESGVFEGYARNRLHPLSGVYGSLGFVIEGGGFCNMTCDMRGILGHPTEVDLPAITYSTVMHPKAEAMGIAIGNYTAGVLRRVEFAQGRVLVDRLDMSGTDLYPGVAFGRLAPTLTIVIEADDLHGTTPWHAAAAIDPDRMYYEGEEFEVSFTLGSTTFNKFTFTASQCQLTGPAVEQDDGPTALWELSMQLNPSTVILSDPYSFLFN